MSNEPSGRDPLLERTEIELDKSCREFFKTGGCTQHQLTGMIIEKLQEWDEKIFWDGSGWWIGGSCYLEKSLPRAFLRTAIILGHWSPPKKVDDSPQYWMSEYGEITRNHGDPNWGLTKWKRVTVTPYKEDK